MIHSMTAFAVSSMVIPIGEINWEVKSLNSRYLDMHFRLPEALRQYEVDLRSLCQSHLGRGKIEISASIVAKSGGDLAPCLNETVVEQLSAFNASISKNHPGIAPLDVSTILSWPGVVKINSTNSKQLQSDILSSFEQALLLLVDARSNEGSKIAHFLKERFKNT